jgi:hypothetical protein
MAINRIEDSTMTLEYARGDSFAREFTITKLDGTGLDITTATILFTVNKRKDPPAVVITDQLFQISGILTTPTSGKFEVKPSSTNTNVVPGDYYYDIQMILGTVKETLAKGIFRILQDITKS